MNLPPFSPFPMLSAGPYLLRALQASDLADVMDILFFDGKKAENLAAAEEILGKIEKEYRDGLGVNWGIADVVNGKIIGTCGFCRGFEHGVGEVGCILSEAFRGKGIMKMAMQTVCRYGMEEMKLAKIVAFTNNDNWQAQHLLNKLNFIVVKNLNDGMVQYEYSGGRLPEKRK